MQGEVFFQDIQSKLIQLLNEAKKSIQIAVAYFSDPVILSTLCKKAESGILVELVIADDINNFKSNSVKYDRLIEVGGTFLVVVGAEKGMLHNKFCILDGIVVLTGSYNWTLRAKINQENMLKLWNDKAFCENFSTEFERIKVTATKPSRGIDTAILETGIQNFDKISGGFHTGSLTFFCSETQSMNVTPLLLSFVAKAIKRHYKVAYICTDTIHWLNNRLLSICTGIAYNKIKTNGTQSGYIDNNFKNELTGIQDYIVHSNPKSWNTDKLRIEIDKLRHSSDLKLVVIDGFQHLFENGFKRYVKASDEVENTVADLKRLARQINIPILCGASLLAESFLQKRKLRYSDIDCIDMYADMVFCLDKDEENDYQTNNQPFVLKCFKNNFDYNNNLEDIYLYKNESTGKFEDCDYAGGNWKSDGDPEFYGRKIYIQKESKLNYEDPDDEAPF